MQFIDRVTSDDILSCTVQNKVFVATQALERVMYNIVVVQM